MQLEFDSLITLLHIVVFCLLAFRKYVEVNVGLCCLCFIFIIICFEGFYYFHSQFFLLSFNTGTGLASYVLRTSEILAYNKYYFVLFKRLLFSVKCNK